MRNAVLGSFLGFLLGVGVLVACGGSSGDSRSNPPEERDVVLTEQVLVDRVIGWTLCGTGTVHSAGPQTPGATFERHIWQGDPNTFAYRVAARNFRVEDLTIVDGGFWLDAVSGFGTGHGDFRRVTFINKGIKAGNVNWNGNAADVVLFGCYFRDCDPCLELTTSQNINYHFINCFFRGCETILEVNGGGNVRFTNCYAIQCHKVIHLTGDGTQTGSQNGQFVIDGFVWDQNQDDSPVVLLDQATSGGARTLDVSNMAFANNFAKPETHKLFTTGNANWTVHMSHARGLTTARSIISATAPSTLVFQNNNVTQDMPITGDGPVRILEQWNALGDGTITASSELP